MRWSNPPSVALALEKQCAPGTLYDRTACSPVTLMLGLQTAVGHHQQHGFSGFCVRLESFITELKAAGRKSKSKL
jgi:hypothetical protein